MTGSFRRLSLLIAVAIGLPAMTPSPVDAQDLRLGLRPTFLTSEPLVVVGSAAAVSRTTQTGGAQRTTPTPAKPAPRFGWEIEGHFGGTWNYGANSTLTLPAPGATFLTFSGWETRAVRSWYFGDGSSLLNAHMAAVSLGSRITALDPILSTSSVGLSGAGTFGARVSRSINARLGAEFAFDMMGAAGLTNAARDAAEATRASFESVFNAMFAGLSPSVTSTLTTTDGGRQMLMTGALTINLRRAGRFIPYAVAGGGALIATGNAPTLRLAGDYRFVSGSGTPYRQTDTLDVQYTQGSAFAMLAGGGFKWYFGARSGLRADFRAHFASNSGTVSINWHPATIAGTPVNTIAFGPSPAIQISTSGSYPSTLALTQATPDFTVATGHGMRELVSFTVGYFYRFPTAAPAPTVHTATTPAPLDRNKKGSRPWEFDVHGGGMFGNQPLGGTAIAAFPVGASFTSPYGQPSRYASSWMFGDGAVLINQIVAGFTGGIPVVNRMVALDPLLTGPSLELSRKGSVGGRVSRRLTSRLRAEFAVEATAYSRSFTKTAADQIDTTRASFSPVWNDLIATGGGYLFTNSSVSATAVLSPSETHWQTSLTGGVEVGLWDSARVETYATGAVGVLRRTAALPEAALTGKYQFLYVGSAPLSEQDMVRVHYAEAQNALLVTFGGGMRWFITPRSGLRVDVRIHVSGNSVDTLVDATPSFVTGTPAFSISSTTNPGLVFSNTSAVRGNLTGPAITNLKTFTGSGQEIQTSVTIGYFFRF